MATPQDYLAANLAALVADFRKGRSVLVFRQVFDEVASDDERGRWAHPPRVIVSVEPKSDG